MRGSDHALVPRSNKSGLELKSVGRVIRYAQTHIRYRSHDYPTCREPGNRTDTDATHDADRGQATVRRGTQENRQDPVLQESADARRWRGAIAAKVAAYPAQSPESQRAANIAGS